MIQQRLVWFWGLWLLSIPILAQTKEFRYTNPIRVGIEGGIRDAQIFRDNNTWYLTGTSAPFWTGPNPGVVLYSSADLLSWTKQGWLIDRAQLPDSVWYYDRFWAPEIHKIGNRYFCLFNARNELGSMKHPHGTAVAVASSLKGPYKVVTDKKPFSGGNDLTFFEDTDGKTYAFWNGSKRMFAAEVDFATMKPRNQREIFYPDAGTWDAIGIEGPYCVKRNGTYYLFYSSWSRGYEIGYATATNPLGPWTKYNGNPIYGAQDKAVCEKNKLPYTQTSDIPWRAVGHNELFTGPDGRLWLSCHGILKGEGEQPYLVIDPLNFDKQGNIRATGPTFTEQIIKLN